MTTPYFGWTSEFSTLTGLDQLGMRVGSEGQYTRLIDFTTTVTWHPRYWSSIAWALRGAYQETVVDGERVERAAWRRAVRRRDYAVAAATLADDKDAAAIIGSERLTVRLDAARKRGAALELGHDHIGQKDQGTASLDVYAGTMMALGLVSERDGIVGPRESGLALAEAFEQTARECGIVPLLLEGEADVASLAQAGAVCGLNELARRAVTHQAPRRELELLRDIVLPWPAFDTNPQVRRRVLSIGLILASHAYCENRAELDLDRFREIVLLGGIRGRDPLSLPPGFGPVLDAWRVYQAHAHTILALEALLALALLAMRGDGKRRVVKRAAVLDDLIAAVVLGAAGGMPVGADVSDFWDRPLGAVLDALDPLVRAGTTAAVAEPEIASRIGPRLRRSGVVRSPEATTHDASLLFLWTVARLRAMGDVAVTAWTGGRDRRRWPPAALVAHAGAAVSRGLTAGAYLREIFDDLVLRQHSVNARRKLAQVPARSTALFLENGAELEGLALHAAGTTNPRFSNAVTHLVDLGYLTPVPPRTLTADGRALLARIEAAA